MGRVESCTGARISATKHMCAPLIGLAFGAGAIAASTDVQTQNLMFGWPGLHVGMTFSEARAALIAQGLHDTSTDKQTAAFRLQEAGRKSGRALVVGLDSNGLLYVGLLQDDPSAAATQLATWTQQLTDFYGKPKSIRSAPIGTVTEFCHSELIGVQLLGSSNSGSVAVRYLASGRPLSFCRGHQAPAGVLPYFTLSIDSTQTPSRPSGQSPAVPPSLQPEDLAQRCLTSRDKGDLQAAIQWGQRSEQSGSARGTNCLGTVLANGGPGVAPDLRRACSLYAKAAHQGYTGAMHNHAVCLAQGHGGTQDRRGAATWFERSAATGDRDSMFELGHLHADGMGARPAPGEAALWYRRAADKGQSHAMYMLGMCYLEATCTARSLPDALRWLTRASLEGVPEAMNQLGVMYEFGNGVAKNHKTAFGHYQAAAKAQLPRAVFNLGRAYSNGTGVDVNKPEAARWYRLAADLGDTDAMTELGWLHQAGEDSVPKDNAAVFSFYKRAAERGHVLAMSNLGWCYAHGTCAARNPALALQWIKKSADLGSDMGAMNLGYLYRNGIGVQRDLQQARKWYQRSAELGNAEALAALQDWGRTTARQTEPDRTERQGVPCLLAWSEATGISVDGIDYGYGCQMR